MPYLNDRSSAAVRFANMSFMLPATVISLTGKAISPFSIQKAGGAAAVVAGHHVDAGAHHLGDEEALLDLRDHLLRADPPRLHPQIGRRRARLAGRAACRVAGRPRARAAGPSAGRAARSSGGRPSITARRRVGRPSPVERLGPQAAALQRIVDHRSRPRGKIRSPHPILQEAGAAGDRRTRDRAGERAQEAIGDARARTTTGTFCVATLRAPQARGPPSARRAGRPRGHPPGRGRGPRW